MPATARRRLAPPQPRRVSGPARPRAVPAGAALRPSPPTRTGAFERLRALPDTRVVDRLLRSRACIWLIGIMLGGIVAMQVSLLRLNTGISRAVETESTLVRKNADLETRIARLASGDRVRAAAIADDMVDPPAGETRYLEARPGTDPWLAARRMKPPSEEARAVTENGGSLPGVGTAGTVASAAGTAGAAPIVPGTATATLMSASAATATATATATPTPAATATTPAPTPTATPIATPVATATPVVTAVPTVAPQG